MKIDIPLPKPGAFLKAGKIEHERLKKANHRAVDQATRNAHTKTQGAIVVAGLGNLSKGVGSTSSQRKGRTSSDNAWGALYAKGGDDSRTGKALSIYSRGGQILPVKSPWLYIATPALKRIVGFGRDRERMTPELYYRLGYNRRLGELQFKNVSANRRVVFVTGVDVLNKNGLAVPRGKRRSKARTPHKIVALFTGIRNTFRAERFNQDRIVQQESETVPNLILQQLQGTV